MRLLACLILMSAASMTACTSREGSSAAIEADGPGVEMPMLLPEAPDAFGAPAPVLSSEGDLEAGHAPPT